jgi:hypothetical protein
MTLPQSSTLLKLKILFPNAIVKDSYKLNKISSAQVPLFVQKLLRSFISFPNPPAAAGQAVWERNNAEAELLYTSFPIRDWERDDFRLSLKNSTLTDYSIPYKAIRTFFYT